MQEFIVVAIIVILLFRAARQFIFFNAYKGFQKAAEDMMKQQQKTTRPEGTVTVQPGDKDRSSSRKGGEYVDFEEIP